MWHKYSRLSCPLLGRDGLLPAPLVNYAVGNVPDLPARPTALPVSQVTFLALLPGLLAFLTLGIIQASYGPAFPALQQRYGVSAAVVAWIASTHFLGSVIAQVITGFALLRFSTRQVVNTGLFTLLLGALVMAFAPAWAAMLSGALVAGVGFGMVSAALNIAYAHIGTRPSNMVNALFGVGSLLAPLVVAATVNTSLSIPFLVVVAFAALSLLAVWFWNVPEVQRQHTHNTPARPVSWALIVVFPLILVTYVSVEVGFGAWIGKHLGSLGWPNPALIISGFWGGLTLGRVLTSIFGPRFRPDHVVLGGVTVGLLAALTVTYLPALAAPAYMLAGVALGPIFGTTLVWISRVLPPQLVPFTLIAGSLGGVISPALVGWRVGAGGPGIIPQTLLFLILFLLAVVLLAFRLAPLSRAYKEQPPA